MSSINLELQESHLNNPGTGEVEIYARQDGLYIIEATGPARKVAGGRWSSGTSFPATPDINENFIFSADVAQGLTWFDTDGTTALTSASRGDFAQYDGTSWRKIINFGGLVTIDGDDLPNIPLAKIPEIPNSKLALAARARQFDSEIQHNFTIQNPSLQLTAEHNKKYIYAEVAQDIPGAGAFIEARATGENALPNGFWAIVIKVGNDRRLGVQGTILYETESWAIVEVVNGELYITPGYKVQPDWDLDPNTRLSGIKNKPVNTVTELELDGDNLNVTRHNDGTNQVLNILRGILKGDHKNAGIPFPDAPSILRGTAINLAPLYAAGLGQMSDYMVVNGVIAVSSTNVILSKDTNTLAEFDRFIDISQVPLGTVITISVTAFTGSAEQMGRVEFSMVPASGTTGGSDLIGHSITSQATVQYVFTKTNQTNHARLWMKGTVGPIMGSRLEITSIAIATNPNYPANSAYTSQGYIDALIPAAQGAGNTLARYIIGDDGATALKVGTEDWVEQAPQRTGAQIATLLNALTGDERLNLASMRGNVSIDQLPFQPRQSTILFSDTTLPAVDHERLIRSIAISDVDVNLEQTILPNGFYARFVVQGTGSVRFRPVNNGNLIPSVPVTTLRPGQVGVLTVTNPQGGNLSYNLTILNMDFRYLTASDLPAPAVLGLHQNTGTVVNDGPDFVRGQRISSLAILATSIGQLSDWDGTTDPSWTTAIANGIFTITRTQAAGGHPTVGRILDMRNIPIGTTITVSFEAQLQSAGQTGNAQFFVVNANNLNPTETPQSINLSGTAYTSHSFTFTRTNATNHARILLQFLVTSAEVSTLRFRNLSVTTNPVFGPNDYLASQGFIDLNTNARPGTNVDGQNSVAARYILGDDGSYAVRPMGAANWIQRRAPVREIIYNPTTKPDGSSNHTATLIMGRKISDYDVLVFCLNYDQKCYYEIVTVNDLETGENIYKRIPYTDIVESERQAGVREAAIRRINDTTLNYVVAVDGIAGSHNLLLDHISGQRF